MQRCGTEEATMVLPMTKRLKPNHFKEIFKEINVIHLLLSKVFVKQRH